MVLYKFRYYQPDELDGAGREHQDSPRRSLRYGHYDHGNYGRRYDPEPSNTVVTSNTPRGDTPPIFHEVTPRTRDAHKRRRRDQPRQFDHHVGHIHYISPRSEPPVTYGAPHQGQPQEMMILKTRANSLTEPRITLFANRKPKRIRRSHSEDHVCPVKSSKAIPSMYYDELRCPQCAAHIQTSQEEVLAYPWTAQSYRPNQYKSNGVERWQARDNRLSLEDVQLPDTNETKENNSIAEHASYNSGARSNVPLSEKNDDRSMEGARNKQFKTKGTNRGQLAARQEPKAAKTSTNGARKVAVAADGARVDVPKARSVGDFTDYAEMSKKSRAANSTLNRIPYSPPPREPLSPVTRQPLSVINGQTFSQSRGVRDDQVSELTPLKPMFRPDNMAPVRSEFRTDGFSNKPYLAQSLSRYNARFDDVSLVKEDDVTPFDSISNVMLPPLRASESESILNRPTARTRAATEVDNSYTRNKYFQSLDQNLPKKVVIPTPRPKKDTASEISRMLKGEYYDRRTGKLYEYNINYSPRKIHSERHPNR
ncbi:hypothetical protein BgiBS90_016082 [Biomphalaria glabrata]|nr:hypothetical protein BgiBS90_016082 [Biomphalaria glabrata]